ncbi:MAG: hypothetical protein LBT90_02370 [Holosporaceae bacterium]|nr:hypothetical protein [Holosporaceae bacterium]
MMGFGIRTVLYLVAVDVTLETLLLSQWGIVRFQTKNAVITIKTHQ